MQFDHLLKSGPTAAANWTGIISYDDPLITEKNIVAIGDGQILGRVVTVPMQQVGLGGPFNKCDYAATPPDVISRRGVAAAAFVDFPLTVV